VYAFTRRYSDDRGEVELLVLGNFTGEKVDAEIDGWAGSELVLGNYPDPADMPDAVRLAVLRPWEARVYRRVRPLRPGSPTGR
jgi:oligo-1,6-glucosidase